MTATISIAAAGATHIGCVRRRNEDAFYVGRNLAAVADGLGGHVAGDVASTVVIESMRRADRDVPPTQLADALGRAIGAANEAMRQRIREDAALAGMGSTLVALLWSGDTAALANVGDSRAYLLRDGRTEQITEDHTYGRLLAGAALVPTLPDRLVRFLDGRPAGRSADIVTWNLRSGDRWLLCSDGLSSYVPHEQIHAVLVSGDSADVACERLVALALDNGGPDNVTVAIVDVGEARP